MPAPQWLARFNRRVTNRTWGRLAQHLPTFAVIIHTGRKSGREYQTPVNVFRHGDCYTIGLPYGRDSDWVRNVLAAGGCTLVMSGRTIRLAQPRLVHDEQRRAMPAFARPILGLFKVSDFLELQRVAGAS
jgi:deazaflavin-dependent oxidoreductase (nitroreductase family)